MTTHLHGTVVGSPVGALAVVTTGHAVCALSFIDDAEDAGNIERVVACRYTRDGGAVVIERASDPLDLAQRIARYFAGELDAFSGLTYDAGGTPFQRRVWAALQLIPAGHTWSYAQLAARVGRTHARAVGGANGRNPIAIAIPCHRVIGADATLTGYAGGLARKRLLLEHEARYRGDGLPLFTRAAS